MDQSQTVSAVTSASLRRRTTRSSSRSSDHLFCEVSRSLRPRRREKWRSRPFASLERRRTRPIHRAPRSCASHPARPDRSQPQQVAAYASRDLRVPKPVQRDEGYRTGCGVATSKLAVRLITTGSWHDSISSATRAWSTRMRPTVCERVVPRTMDDERRYSRILRIRPLAGSATNTKPLTATTPSSSPDVARSRGVRPSMLTGIALKLSL